jgi:hypothetical protein
MRKPRFTVAASLVFLLGAFASGCGDDDEGDEGGEDNTGGSSGSGSTGGTGNGGSGGSGGSTADVGTCDLRSVSQSCIELHDASAIDLQNQEEGCLDAGGIWTNLECPTDELVGCCDYEFGNTFHECFYTGIARDPVAYCTGTVDGVWTPAS